MRNQTAPLIGYYRGQGRLVEVGGEGPVETVYAQLKRAVGVVEPSR